MIFFVNIIVLFDEQDQQKKIDIYEWICKIKREMKLTLFFLHGLHNLNEVPGEFEGQENEHSF